MIPGRGAWLEFEVDKKDIVYVRIDRKRKQPVTVLLKALEFGDTDDALLGLITDDAGRRCPRCCGSPCVGHLAGAAQPDPVRADRGCRRNPGS